MADSRWEAVDSSSAVNRWEAVEDKPKAPKAAISAIGKPAQAQPAPEPSPFGEFDPASGIPYASDTSATPSPIKPAPVATPSPAVQAQTLPEPIDTFSGVAPEHLQDWTEKPLAPIAKIADVGHVYDSAYDPERDQFSLEKLEKTHPELAKLIRGIGQQMATPIDGPPAQPTPEQAGMIGEAGLNTAADVQHVAAEKAEGLTTPKNAAILGTLTAAGPLGIPAIVTRLVSLGFAADMAHGAAQEISKAYQQHLDGDDRGAILTLSGAGIDAIMAMQAGIHGAKPESKPKTETETQQQPAPSQAPKNMSPTEPGFTPPAQEAPQQPAPAPPSPGPQPPVISQEPAAVKEGMQSAVPEERFVPEPAPEPQLAIRRRAPEENGMEHHQSGDVQEAAINAVQNERPRLRQEYAALGAKTRNGRFHDADEYKPLLYPKDSSLTPQDAARHFSSPAHHSSSEISKIEFEHQLAEEPASDTSTAHIVTGMAGSGKTTVALDTIKDSHAGISGNFSNYGKLKNYIDRSIDAGHYPEIIHVHIDPVEAYQRMLKRGMRTGRFTHIDAFMAMSHADDSVLKALGQDGDRAGFKLFDNSAHGKGQAREITPGELQTLADQVKARYNNDGELRARLKEKADELWQQKPDGFTDRDYAKVTGEPAPKARLSQPLAGGVQEVAGEAEQGVHGSPGSKLNEPGGRSLLQGQLNSRWEPVTEPAENGRLLSSPPKPGEQGVMDPQAIHVDPELQFKQATGPNQTGASKKIQGDEPFDPERAGTVDVWQNPKDGKTYIVDGHHRLELAKNDGAAEIKVNHIEAADKEAAYRFGAERNIERGNVRPEDLAAYKHRVHESEPFNKNEQPKKLNAKEQAKIDASQKSEKKALLDKTMPAIEEAGGKYRGSEGIITPEKQYEYYAHFEKDGQNLRLRAGETDLAKAEASDLYKKTEKKAAPKPKPAKAKKVSEDKSLGSPTEILKNDQGQEGYRESTGHWVIRNPNAKDLVDWHRVTDPSSNARFDREFTSAPATQAQPEGLEAGALRATMVPAPVIRATHNFLEQDVTPTLKKFGAGLAETFKTIQHTLNPRSDVPSGNLDSIMKLKGERDKQMFVMEQTMKGIKASFDKLPQDQQISFIDRYKLGRKQMSPELDQVAALYRKIDGDTFTQLKKFNPTQGWKEDHFRVMWKEIPGAQGKQGFFGMGRRPLQGSQGMMKQSTLETMSEGIAKGGVPVSYNPQHLFELAQSDALRFISAQRMWENLKDNGQREFIKAGDQVPDGFSRLDDRIARVFFPYLDKAGDPKIARGEWYVEGNTARVLNNFLSRDLIREHAAGRGLMAFKNHTTALELALSPFHASFVTFEATAGQQGIGLLKIANQGIRNLDPKAFIDGLHEVVTSPLAPKRISQLGGDVVRYVANKQDFLNTTRGQNFIKRFPDADRLIDDLFTGGGKLAMHEDYRTNSIDAFKKALANNNEIGAMLRAFPAANQAMMRPLFDTYIPRLKVGMFLKEYSQQLAENHDALMAGKMTRPELARKTWDRMENRFGEMNFDNLFWNRTMKSALQFLFRSVTWKMGTVRGFAGAAKGQAANFLDPLKAVKEGDFGQRLVPKLDPNMAWLSGVALTTATAGSLLHFMFTGQAPADLKDVMHPRTGGVDERGKPLRMTIPTYFKDAEHIEQDIKKKGLAHGMASYAGSSLSSAVFNIGDAWNNEDFYGNYVYNPKAPAITQLGEIINHSINRPFSLQNISPDVMRKAGIPKGIAETVGSRYRSTGNRVADLAGTLGFTKARRDYDFTPAEQRMTEILEAQGHSRKTPEEAERSRALHELVRMGKEHDPDVLAKMAEAKGSGDFSERDLDSVRSQTKEDWSQKLFKHLSLEEAMEVYKLGSKDEQKKWRSMMYDKQDRAYRELSRNKMKELQPQFREMMHPSAVAGLSAR